MNKNMKKNKFIMVGVNCLNIIVMSLLVLFASCQQRNKTGKARDHEHVISPLKIGLKSVLPGALRESSGLCYTENNLWTFGDGGNPNKIYKIDSSTGEILQTVEIENFPNIDWEDITADSTYIYIGDFGNNNGNRKDLKIIRIRKSDLNSQASMLRVYGEAINFSYTDQTNFDKASSTDFDCESVISIRHFLYVFTKDGVDFKTRCYRIPDQPGNYKVSPISSFDTEGKVTAAAFNPVTREIALLGYATKKRESFIWFLDGYRSDEFFGGKTDRITIGTGKDWQTEGLDYVSTKRLFMSCETSKSQVASLYFVQKN
jgi:hypothetical protein